VCGSSASAYTVEGYIKNGERERKCTCTREIEQEKESAGESKTAREGET